MPPSNFGARASTATQWNCVRIADRLRARVEHQLQHGAGIVGRAPDDEVVDGVSPDLPQPVEIRFESAGGQHDGPGTDGLHAATRRHRHGAKAAIPEVESGHAGVVQHPDAQAPGRGVVAVHQRLAAAEKVHVGPPEVQRAPERRLQPDAEALHPAGAAGRPAHDQARERFVGSPRRHAHEVADVFVLRVRVGQERRRRVVHRPEVARVAAVAAAKSPRRPFEHDDRGPALARGERRAEARVAAAEHRDVEGFSQPSP